MVEGLYQAREISVEGMRNMYGRIGERYNVSPDCQCGICDCACFGGGVSTPVRQTPALEVMANEEILAKD